MPTLSPQRRVGSFILLERLGTGGIGEVWKARDHRLNRVVALKFILSDPSKPAHDLAREARAASALNHPNIVTIFEIGESDGGTYIAMEFIEGETLRTRMGESRLPFSDALNVVTQMARGLAAAHDSGIVHRDVKPENVMVRVDGYVKLVDFGLAKRLPWSASPDQTIDSTDPTATGQIAGTFAYMSPEQARGQAVGPPSDVFSFGIVLYELLTGEHPFRTDNPIDTLHRIINSEPVSTRVRCPEIPQDVHRIVERCLHKDKTQRFQSARELESHLRIAEGPSEKSAAKTWIVVTVLLVALAIAIGLWSWASRPAPAFQLDSIAVRNFATPPQDTIAATVAQGLSERLGGLLTKEGFLIAPRTRVLALSNEEDPLKVGAQLHVDAVLEGVITTNDGTAYNLYVELVDTKKGFQVWSTSIPLGSTDVMEREVQAAAQIANQIHAAAGRR